MIQEIRLENFQAHRQLRLALSPGLNVIVGPTDRGKSAIIRAIKWLALHESQDGIITHGETSVKVGVKTDEGPIVRFRDKKKYGYKLGLAEYLACGKEQPKDVQARHNLSEINFQGQHDPHFLLSLTPGQAAKEINKIVALDDIDVALTWIKTREIRSNTEIELSEARCSDLGVQILTFSDLDNRLAILRSVEAIVINGEIMAKMSSDINKIVEEWYELTLCSHNLASKIERLERYLAAVSRLTEIRAAKQALGSVLIDYRASESLPRLDALAASLEALVTMKRNRVDFVATVAELAKVMLDIDSVSSEIPKLLGKAECIVTATRDRKTVLVEIVNSLKELRQQFVGVDSEIKAVETAKEAMGQFCPTCGKLLEKSA
jgi:exonuclease SbcC